MHQVSVFHDAGPSTPLLLSPSIALRINCAKRSRRTLKIDSSRNPGAPFRRYSLLAAMLLVMIVLIVMPAGAQERRVFNIPAQPLSDALTTFGRQSGLQITYRPELTAGLSSRAVSGSYTPEQALQTLLSGLGLTYRFIDANTVMVEQSMLQQQGGERFQIEQTTVEARKEALSTAVIGNLPEPYAGGQVATGGQVGILGNRDIMDTPFNQTNYTAELMQNQQIGHIADAMAKIRSSVFASMASIATATPPLNTSRVSPASRPSASTTRATVCACPPILAIRSRTWTASPISPAWMPGYRYQKLPTITTTTTAGTTSVTPRSFMAP